MSKNEFDFDLEDILAEFSDASRVPEAEAPPVRATVFQPEQPPVFVPIQGPVTARQPHPERYRPMEPAPVQLSQPVRQTEPPVPAEVSQPAAYGQGYEQEAAPGPVRKAFEEAAQPWPDRPAPASAAPGRPESAGAPMRREPVYPAPEPEDDEDYEDDYDDYEGEEEEEDASGTSRASAFFLSAVRNVLGFVFAAVSVFVLGWMLMNVHPDPIALTSAPAGTKMNLLSEFDNYVNNAASDALGDLTYIKKIYTIPENATSAPAPNQALFGSTTNPDDILALIDSAAFLLNGQEVAFNPNADFQAGKEIRYYFDETILAITWKEIIEGKCCSCAEIKVADGSQIRRKLADDTYGSAVQLYASDMAKAANAIVAINGDFYAFRPIGITAYQRQIYRCNSPTLDTCFFTASGDMLFSYAGEHTDWDETQKFVDDNDVLWAVTFGPILVDNGELRTIDSYPIGEIDRTYSRASIGMLDNLHYFLMTVNYDDGYQVAVTLNQFAQFMYEKGCQKAYALDGGQTSILLMNGEWVNHVDFGNERTMSDIIYFATALPEGDS